MSDKLRKKMSKEDYETLKIMAVKYADGKLEGLANFLKTNLKESVTMTVRCNTEEKLFIYEKLKGRPISSYGVDLLNHFMDQDGLSKIHITSDCFKNHGEHKMSLNIKDKEVYEKIKSYADQYKLPASIMMRIGILKELGYPFDKR